MNPRYRTFMMATLLALGGGGVIWAQAQPVPQGKKVEQVEPPKSDGKDPTSPSPKLKELLFPDKAGKIGAANAPPRIPVVMLRGRVLSKTQPPIALLEIDGRLYSVTKGSSLSGGNLTTLNVLEINGDEVRIEVSPLREVISLK